MLIIHTNSSGDITVLQYSYLGVIIDKVNIRPRAETSKTSIESSENHVQQEVSSIHAVHSLVIGCGSTMVIKVKSGKISFLQLQFRFMRQNTIDISSQKVLFVTSEYFRDIVLNIS